MTRYLAPMALDKWAEDVALGDLWRVIVPLSFSFSRIDFIFVSKNLQT